VAEPWRVIKRFKFNASKAVCKQSLLLYFDGVLAYRDPTSGKYVFRDGIKEGL
jgi:hypothetical protein